MQITERPGTVPAGFTAYADENPPTTDLSSVMTLELRQIQFSDGPPSEQAWLAPDRDERTWQGWHFEPSPGKQIWFSCSYSDSKLLLSAPLPADLKYCKVTHDPAILGYPATGMACK
jgi:hypothetical protein